MTTQALHQTVIYFWIVRDVQKKLATVCHLAKRHFARKERVLITTPSAKAAQFVDDLLWKNPPDSFLPHAISQEPLQAAVVITYPQEGGQVVNLNEATIIINLCPDISPLGASVSCVHELHDQTDPEKQLLSDKRFADYEAAGFLCCKEMA